MEWETAYKKYKRDVGCPISSRKKIEELEWILGYAIRLEYADNCIKIFLNHLESLSLSVSFIFS